MLTYVRLFLKIFPISPFSLVIFAQTQATWIVPVPSPFWHLLLQTFLLITIQHSDGYYFVLCLCKVFYFKMRSFFLILHTTWIWRGTIFMPLSQHFYHKLIFVDAPHFHLLILNMVWIYSCFTATTVSTRNFQTFSIDYYIECCFFLYLRHLRCTIRNYILILTVWKSYRYCQHIFSLSWFNDVNILPYLL